MGSTRSRTGWLLVLTTVPPLVETVIFSAFGYRAAQALAPQLTAVWPYDSYHDMRWLFVYHNSWAVFVVGLVALVGLRGLFSGLVTWLAWPTGRPRPTFRWLLVRNLRVAALAALVVSPWAILSVFAAVVSLSWFLAASLVPMLVIAPFLQRAGVTEHWWRGLPSIEQVGWTLLNVAALTVVGAALWSVGRWWDPLVVIPGGIVNGLLWRQTIRAAVLPTRVRWARVPVAPLVAAVLVVAAAGGYVRVTTNTPGPGGWRPPLITRPLPATVDRAVIVLAGYGTAYDGQPAVDPAVVRFSYRGLDGQGRPLPYAPEDTHRSLESSTALLAAQVDVLHRRTGRPVALVGESEGAMVARTYVERRPGSPVDTVLMFSPLVRPGRVYYPPRDERTGWGIAAGWALRILLGLGNLISPGEDVNADQPFLRSLLDDAPFYRSRTLCPVPGVRMLAFVPTVAATEAPPRDVAGIPVFEIPALHGGLLGRAVVQDEVVRFLGGAPVSGGRREYDLFQRLSGAWQAPSLVISINPAWRVAPSFDPSFTPRRAC
ncbi:hypothetical protein [Micromonospora cathayae]|uniref:Alpha/beta hydrolase family protein n=1 Tax=Micromonospora cathayae TaxID=3028804 RepID=A0ABY7ZX62_9ACTN|nr:hypothetical protein [Micromonospora sp. HUAS 3]WDZ87667.1 hypothetical protein PVK37_15280 [Micromonospora sp. HUAS 3]